MGTVIEPPGKGNLRDGTVTVKRVSQIRPAFLQAQIPDVPVYRGVLPLKEQIQVTFRAWFKNP